MVAPRQRQTRRKAGAQSLRATSLKRWPVYGRGGNDDVRGDNGSDPVLSGGMGNDEIRGNVGGDHAFGGPGNDTIRMFGDNAQDFVNCGEDSDGTDADTAYVSGNDVVDGTRAGLLTTTLATNCERIFVDGVAIPQL